MLVCFIKAQRQSCLFTQMHLKYGCNFTRNRMKTVTEHHHIASKLPWSLHLTLLCLLPSSQLTLRTFRHTAREQDREIDMGLMWCACQKGSLTFHVLTTLQAPPSWVHASFGLSPTP